MDETAIRLFRSRFPMRRAAGNGSGAAPLDWDLRPERRGQGAAGGVDNLAKNVRSRKNNRRRLGQEGEIDNGYVRALWGKRHLPLLFLVRPVCLGHS